MNDETNGASTPPEGELSTLPPPAAPPPRPVFRRHDTDRVLSGVAGGLARTFGVDPVIVRVVTVVLAITFPPAFVAYLAAWLLVARDSEPSSTTVGNTAFRQSGGVWFWIGTGVLAIATLAILDDPFRGDLDLLPLVLIGIGVALWTRDGSRAPRPVAAATTAAAVGPSADPSPHASTDLSSHASTEAPTAWPAASGPAPFTVPVREPRPPRPRSPLGAVTIAFALIAAGVVAALDQLELPIDADPTHLAAVALLVLGLGLLVGAVWGRARWLAFVALLLLPAVLGGAAYRAVSSELDLGTQLAIGDGIGERNVSLFGQETLPGDVRLLAGSSTVDLTAWSPDDVARAALDDDDQDLLVEVGAGEVIILPPTDVAWRVVGSVGLGEAVLRDVFGTTVEQRTTSAPGDALDVVYSGGPPGSPVLDIVVRLELGELTVVDPSANQELS